MRHSSTRRSFTAAARQIRGNGAYTSEMRHVIQELDRSEALSNHVSARKVALPSNKKRRVALWLVRENGSVVEVFVLKGKDNQTSLLYKNVGRNAMEAPDISLAEKILKTLGINEEKVEFLKVLKKGKSGEWDDLWSYVSMVSPKNAAVVLKSKLGKQMHLLPISSLTKELSERPDSYTRDMKEDLPDVIEFLTPIIKTAGKNPAKCLGPPPGWREEAKRKLPWPRTRK